ncbi:unannotated protein [freshwater metagenome]|uniref:Unannotated protein n=1 Tax=freshwater metagenome TaxID=449393 RepID=A0A6J7HIQ9_9ZZZZ|nr:hypothetical protein [Actinomycetota bacterium]MUH57002.1 hypothetical protein [Actinomycetota bacterium]
MRKILVPALAVFALFAVSSCGDDPDASGPPILVLATGGAWSSTAPAASDMSSSEGMDEKMMWGYQQHLTAAADLPALDSDARVYTLVAGDVSTDSMNALKEAFDVTADFVAQDADQGGGYLSGNYTTTPTLYVGSDAMRYWSYSPAWEQSPMSSQPCVYEQSSATAADPSVDPLAPVVEICAEPAAPENVPTKAEAEALFAATMTVLGINNEDLILDSYSDEWGANVNGYLKIDGIRSPLSWNVGYGADATITWASGVFADVQDGASYPRIGTAAAIDRLNSQQAGNWGGPMVRGGYAYDTAMDATPMPVPALSDVEAAVTTAPPSSDVVTTEVMPLIDAPEPVVQEISIVGVEEELVTLYGADGSIYLVPGYTFIAAEDEYGYAGRYTVSALPDEYMQVADAVNEVPMTEVPVPDTAVATPSVDPAVDPDMSVAQDVADTVLGMSEAEATQTAEAKGLTVRVGSRDGEDFPLTMDYRTDRVTLTVKADKVTAVVAG